MKAFWLRQLTLTAPPLPPFPSPAQRSLIKTGVQGPKKSDWAKEMQDSQKAQAEVWGTLWLGDLPGQGGSH